MMLISHQKYDNIMLILGQVCDSDRKANSQYGFRKNLFSLSRLKDSPGLSIWQQIVIL